MRIPDRLWFFGQCDFVVLCRDLVLWVFKADDTHAPNVVWFRNIFYSVCHSLFFAYNHLSARVGEKYSIAVVEFQALWTLGRLFCDKHFFIIEEFGMAEQDSLLFFTHFWLYVRRRGYVVVAPGRIFSFLETGIISPFSSMKQAVLTGFTLSLLMMGLSSG